MAEDGGRQLAQVVVGEALKPERSIGVVGTLDDAVPRETPLAPPCSPAGSARGHVSSAPAARALDNDDPG